jgi:hypothetical protein
MPIPNCELEGTSVVLVGNFNPAIFHPSWLASHNMVRGGEAEKAQIQIVSPEFIHNRVAVAASHTREISGEY